ncbi:MAG: hypothetical protein IGR76_13905 [Synechococcales cyanobacterium T60_A2020_003]|nr:hypothetical protein [Synechococcales cyanobacterium T60_A2020_003]
MTAQIGERLIFDGKETSMAFCPPLPKGHPRIIEIDPDKAKHDDSAPISLILLSTACWRGYQGTWEIKDGQFYLVDLCGRFRLQGEEPLLADWFSGVLRIPRGEMLQYVHMGFGSIFEEEVHVKIERGKVITSRVINNRGKKQDEWELSWLNLPGGENRFPGDDEL